MAGQIIDISGRTFGNFKVISFDRVDKGNAFWNCLCSCGTTKSIRAMDLKAGRIKGCGCKRNKYKDPQKTSINIVLRRYRRQAKERGLEWDLTYDMLCSIIKLPCYYCGAPPSNYSSPYKYKDGRQRQCAINSGVTKERSEESFLYYNGIDRKDNKIGYTKNNCVSCCAKCNRAKQDVPLEEFLLWLKQVSKHYEMQGGIWHYET